MQLLDKQAKLTQQLEEEEMQWLDAQEQMEAQRASYEAQ
jgi:ATP-binding cassette subfamily F protein 3